jgi:hypothetical protein
MADKTMRLASLSSWNRKLHIYVGLYMLFFIWLFSISGLLMNHTDWFTHQPTRSPAEQTVSVLAEGTDLAKAQDVMKQLGITGEVLLRGPRKPGYFNFGVIRPNRRVFVTIDLQTSVAKLSNVDLPMASVLGDLHTFTGVRGIWREEPSIRDWLPTQIWSLCIDAVCVGLLFLVGSSLYMGSQLKGQRIGFMVSLALGVVLSSFFLWGLAASGI